MFPGEQDNHGDILQMRRRTRGWNELSISPTSSPLARELQVSLVKFGEWGYTRDTCQLSPLYYPSAICIYANGPLHNPCYADNNVSQWQFHCDHSPQ